MNNQRRSGYLAILVSFILVGWTVGFAIYDAGYRAGEWAVVEEVIEHQKEIVYWSAGGYVNSTLYNESWYFYGDPGQEPSLTDDCFIMSVIVNVIIPEQDDAGAFFDCNIRWDNRFGNITLERILYSTEVYNFSHNRDGDFLTPVNSTGFANIYDCYWILRLSVFGYGDWTTLVDANIMASPGITIRPVIGGG